jgi:hypothetical protein
VGLVTGCNSATTNVDGSTRNLQNIKDRHADQPAKKCDTLPHPRVVYFVEPPLLKNNSYSKIYGYARCLCAMLQST